MPRRRLDLHQADDTGWMQQANCRGLDPELFHPERGGAYQQAKQVCAGCVVRDECLAYALDTRQKFGIWGGTSDRQRRRIIRDRRKGAA